MRPTKPIHIPIAMLHSVGTMPDASLQGWSLTNKAFLQLLDFIEKNRFQTTHFAEIAEGTDPPSSKKIILTFDDCYKHLFDYAVPELLKRGMKAAFYISTANLGGYNSWDTAKGTSRLSVMNENDLKELACLGMEIGSHSHDHIELSKLSQVEKVKEQVIKSKKIIEDVTGKRVYSFSYPFGSVPKNYKEMLSEAGYLYAVGLYCPLESPFSLRRFGVYEKDNLNQLQRKTSNYYRWMRKAYDFLKDYN